MPGSAIFAFAGNAPKSAVVDLGDFNQRFGNLNVNDLVGAVNAPSVGTWALLGSVDNFATTSFLLGSYGSTGSHPVVTGGGDPVALPRWVQAQRDSLGQQANVCSLSWSEPTDTVNNDPVFDSVLVRNTSLLDPLTVLNATATLLLKLWNSTGELDLGPAVNTLGLARLADLVLSRPLNPIFSLEGNASAPGPMLGGGILWSNPVGQVTDSILSWILGAGAPGAGSRKLWGLTDANQRYFQIRSTNTLGDQGNWDVGGWAAAGGPAAYNWLRSLATKPLNHYRATLNAGVNLAEWWDDTGAGTLFAAIGNAGKLTQQSGDSSGAPGNATVNTPVGYSAIAAGANSVTITNNQVNAGSKVLAWIQQAAPDATVVAVLPSVPGAGSFIVKGLNAAGAVAVTTAATKIAWRVYE